jgi:uncharacterized protein YciI
LEFLCYHRDRACSGPLRDDLLEAHWSYMDGFEAELIARGPTLDGDVATGSLHIVDVADAAAARAFALDEPGWQAGVYRDVLLRRWRNLLGRTMWEWDGPRDGWLVIGLGSGEPVDDVVPAVDLIAYGPLLSDDGASWLGTAALVPSTVDPLSVFTADEYASVEVHAWQFGGRR